MSKNGKLTRSLMALSFVLTGEIAFSEETANFEPRFDVIYENLPTEENGNWCKFRLAMSAPAEQLKLVEDLVFDIHPTMGEWRYSGVATDKSSPSKLVSDDRDTNVLTWQTNGTKVTLKNGKVLSFGPIQIDCRVPMTLKSGPGSQKYGKHTYRLTLKSDYQVTELHGNEPVSQVLTQAAGGSSCILGSSESLIMRFNRDINAYDFMSSVSELSSGKIQILEISYYGDGPFASCGDGSGEGWKL